MRKFDSNIRAKPVRKNSKEEKSSEVYSAIRESERDPIGCLKIKTLAGAQWNEMKKVKDELKAMLPILKPSEVKRFYLPFHEVIIDELEENGYRESVDYLQKLTEFDEEIRKEAGPGTLIWEKPCLKDNKKAMMRLKEGLMAYEERDITSATMEFLKMAQFFQAMTREWWWVAERLYHSALVNAELIKNDEQLMITLTRYLYGRFLFEQNYNDISYLFNYKLTFNYALTVQNAAESLNYLNTAREASQAKPWTASKITGRKEENIFYKCNVLLCRALLIYAQQIESESPDIAVGACIEALERAKDSKKNSFPLKNYSKQYYKSLRSFLSIHSRTSHQSFLISIAGHNKYIANALYKLGESQLRSGKVLLALQNFSKFLAIAKRIPDQEEVCNAHMALAFTYKLCLIKRQDQQMTNCKFSSTYFIYFNLVFISIYRYILYNFDSPHERMLILDSSFRLLTFLQKLDDDVNAEKHFYLFKENATIFGFTTKLAQAHYHIGEYFLSKVRLHIATAQLEKSFALYNKLDLHNDANKARIFGGVSKGQEIIDQYIDLILQCGEDDLKATSTLCQWKDRRSAFWTKKKLYAGKR
nr:PREDICTED: uncharacterized protein LOC105669475 [Linepithema humile]